MKFNIVFYHRCFFIVTIHITFHLKQQVYSPTENRGNLYGKRKSHWDYREDRSLFRYEIPKKAHRSQPAICKSI